jgi:thiol-disulfide isomerase/thioredoxin
MARTPSNMIPLNTVAPSFNLLDTISKKNMSLEHIKGEKATVIIFMCNHCPFVIHVIEELVVLANFYQTKGVSFIAISSNDVEKQSLDSPDLMREEALASKYPFPYLYDESQEVAHAYDAACTPDFYIFNKDLKLKYRGQLDDSRPENSIEVSGDDLRYALDCVLENSENVRAQKPSIGCNIKWKN